MKSYILSLIFLPTAVSAVLEFGGKTQYQLRQYDSGLGREQSLLHTHTTTDLGNPQGITVQAVPFVSVATNTGDIAKQLTLKKTKALLVASDRFLSNGETTLPYHAIKHNTDTDAAEEAATVNLSPSLTVAGTTLSFFHDGSQLQPGLAGTLSVPVFYIDAHLGQTGATSTINDYLRGSYSQTTPQQDALLYGLFGDSNAIKVGPISAQLNYNVIENEKSFAGGALGLSVALLAQHDQRYLFSSHSSAHDHHKVFLGFDAGTTLYQTHNVTAEVMVNARYSYLFSGTEKRILGVYEDDGSTPALSPYLLGAEKGKKGVFPLANILHRDVHRSGNHQLETNMMGALTWRTWTANLGYGFFARREESIKPVEWTEDTYAITYNTYNTANNFANSAATGSLEGADILLNHRFITEDMINTTVAQSPQQVSVTLFASAGYNNKVRNYPIAGGIGLSYDHSLVRAAPSMLTFWAKVAVSF